MKILLVTTGPMPFDRPDRIFAMSIRAWLLAREMLKREHQVFLVAIDTLPRTEEHNGSIFSHFEQEGQPFDFELYPQLRQWCGDIALDRLVYYDIPAYRIVDTGWLDSFCAEWGPDCLVVVGNYAAHAATSLKTDLPRWGDLAGSYMAEAQAKAYVYEDDFYLDYFRRQELAILSYYDYFSAVSQAQLHALVGELGLAGRLNRATYGQPLAFAAPIAFDDLPPLPASEPVIRGRLCGPEDFALLWSGGFNTWTDVETLFAGVDAAMARCPRLHLVITGGQIDGHDEKTFPAFQSMVAGSPYRERYHFEGWVEQGLLYNYYLESDAGIILDRWSYEGLLGSRSRVLEWGRFGLPAISTLTSELMYELKAAGALFSFRHRDGPDLADLLARLAGASDRVELRQAGRRLQTFALENYSPARVYEPILAWVEQPVYAPDRQLRQASPGGGWLLPGAASSELEEARSWARHLQAELSAKEFIITRLRHNLQSYTQEYEKLKDWALSLEQQLLVHSARGKK